MPKPLRDNLKEARTSAPEPPPRHGETGEAGRGDPGQTAPLPPPSRVLLATIGRPHGVRGLVRVTSYASSPEALARYTTLHAEDGRRFSLRWRGESIAEITDLDIGRVTDRTAAERLTNLRLYIERDQLPPPDDDEFYVADLIGLAAVSADGSPLGRIATVHDYGAGVSLETETGLLVPFTRAAVPTVDLAAGRVTIAQPGTIDVAP